MPRMRTERLVWLHTEPGSSTNEPLLLDRPLEMMHVPFCNRGGGSFLPVNRSTLEHRQCAWDKAWRCSLCGTTEALLFTLASLLKDRQRETPLCSSAVWLEFCSWLLHPTVRSAQAQFGFLWKENTSAEADVCCLSVHVLHSCFENDELAH